MASVTLQKPIARRGPRKSDLRRWATSYLMLAPFLVLFLVFTIFPILQSAYLSLTKFTGIKAPEFIGLKNYIDLFSDQRFLKSMSNVARYVVLAVSLNTLLGFIMALVFRATGRVTQIFRTLFFMPAVSGIAAFTVWGWILTGEDYGLANTIRRFLGLEPLRFLSTPSLAIPILVTLAVWGGIGGAMIYFLAGLQGISNEYIEAAAIDGATPAQRLRFIVVPLLRPAFLYIIITGLIGAIQVFAEVYVVFSSVSDVGGILDSALTPVAYLYHSGFNRFKLGYASAIAYILFMIIIVLTILNLRIGRANESDQ